MSLRVWVRCVVVSLIASAMVPPLTLVALAPSEGVEVIDLRKFDRNSLTGLSEGEATKRIVNAPMRRVTGIERFTYWFTEPNWVLNFWPSVVTWFGLFMGATVCVSYLNGRDKRGT